MNGSRRLGAALSIAAWAAIAFYAAVVIHNFYQYVDRAIYVTVDDGEAGIAYLLATHGRYGFLASPLLEGMSRLHAQFNYGPWYFWLAAAVTWLFGYSLTAIRSIHLAVVLLAAVTAGAWFRGRNRLVAPALFATGILYFFSNVQWPMARPDSLVTAFAIGAVVCAGLGVTRRRAFYWFLCGMMAACGAFTHLIAAALVPAAILAFGSFAILEWQESTDRRRTKHELLWPALALVAGLAAGAAMFYAAFGFDVAMQLRFLRGYRHVTASRDTYTQALQHHFSAAFGSGAVPAWLRMTVVTTFLAGWGMVVASALRRSPQRRAAVAYLLPPLLVWTLYFISNGAYTNYHSGYAILHHAMFLWTAAAIVWIFLDAVERRASGGAILLGAVLSVAVASATVRIAAAELKQSPRVEDSASMVSFGEYADRVLGAIPARSSAWGSVVFGIESPERVQLVQQIDAATLARQVPAAERPSIAPDYLVWGSLESRENALALLHDPPGANADSLWTALDETLPGIPFRVVALTSGEPYGVTRVYGRRSVATSDSRLPAVAAFDGAHRRWLTRVGTVLPVPFTAVAPVALGIGLETTPRGRASNATVSATLPSGFYLLHVAITPGAGRTSRGLLAAVSEDMLVQTIGQLGPRGDFAPYLAGDREAFALVAHPGGALYVSQFDGGAGAAINGVTAYPVLELLDPDERPSRSRALPAFSAWSPASGVKAPAQPERLVVDGDATALGYQVSSPVIATGNGDRIELRVPSTIRAGRVCVGALNADSSRWLVTADRWREVLQFRGDASGGFRLVFANCNTAGQAEPSRFEVGSGAYVDDPPELYADRLASLAFGLKPSEGDLRSDDLAYVAPIVARDGAAWKAQGTAESKYSYLLASKPRSLDAGTRVLVTGSVARGGLTIGLQQKDRWLGQTNVESPGDFRVVLAPPASGSYAVVVANYLGDSLATSVVIDRIGVFGAESVPR